MGYLVKPGEPGWRPRSSNWREVRDRGGSPWRGDTWMVGIGMQIQDI